MQDLNSFQITDFTNEGFLFGSLTKLTPKLQEEAGERFFSWQMEFTTEVDTSWVNELENSIPSATSYHSKAINEKAFTTITVKPIDSLVKIKFRDAATNAVFFENGATVINIKLNMNDKSQAFVAKLRMDHVGLSESLDLLDCLGRNVVLESSPAQQTLSMFSNTVKVGQLVSSKVGGRFVYGIVVDSNGDTFTLDDFGVRHECREVLAALDVKVDESEIARYTGVCSNLGGSPSWQMMVTAIAAQDTIDSNPVVGRSTIDTAIDIQFGGSDA